MKVKLNLSVFAVAIVFMLAVTGYACPTDNHHHEESENNAREHPHRIMPSDKATLDISVTEPGALENALPTSPTTSAKEPLVSTWLEARATNEAITSEAARGKSSAATTAFIAQDEGMMLGGGWCNSCGCWLRHGCDSNGTCNNGHQTLCASWGMACELHPGTNCINS